MTTHIQLKLYATLKSVLADASEHYPIEPGMTVLELIGRLGISKEEAKLVFINGIRGDLQTILKGGERVGIFPPVGGG